MEKVSLQNLSSFAKRVLEQIEKAPRDSARAHIVALQGELGAGKTTFTQALAKALWIQEVVQSPTYVLMKSYNVPPPAAGGWIEKLVHIDAYRLESPEQFSALKPETFLSDPHALVLIEWPKRVEGALPKANLTINFSSENAAEGERFVEIQ